MLTLVTALLGAVAAPAGPYVPPHHQLEIRLDPERHRLVGVDRVTLPAVVAGVGFALHAGLQPEALSPGVTLHRVNGPVDAGFPADAGFGVAVEWYRAELPADTHSFAVGYAGEIHHPLSAEETYARGFRQTPGTVSMEGVFLSGATAWHPRLAEPYLTFDLRVQLPAGWDAVSQGGRTERTSSETETRVRWADPTPQEEVYLLAARYTEGARTNGPVEVQVFLRNPEPALTEKYLETGGQYLRMYSELLGAYPYPKFALVENFWETGYGMPSFSLLGPRVIRFPFILHSSYPHEILHNWWGNGVYVDWQSGNWCEGLTAYLADHLIQEGRGQGAEHRQTTLQKYADYVSAEGTRDFPLVEFTSRHSAATEAVGYGKALMFYHMLRRELGDQTFIAGLRRLYAEKLFQLATFDDIRRALEEASGHDLSTSFLQWTRRVGAPQLAAGGVALRPAGDGWRLAFSVRQTQGGEPYRLTVPVVVTTADGTAHRESVLLDRETAEFQLSLAERPVRVDVDPEFDLFRLLDPLEIPPALSGAFGAEAVTVVLPAAAPDGLRVAYRELAEGWGRSQLGRWTVVDDRELEQLPADEAVWVLGWENRFQPAAVATLQPYPAEVSPGRVRVDSSGVDAAGHCFVLVGRHPNDPGLTLTWLATDDPAPLPGLGRKLPHYHKYSYLAFEGAEPQNILKGRWPVVGSPLAVPLEPDAAMGLLPERRPLAELPPAYSDTRMGADVAYLAAVERQGRGFGSAGLEQSGAYIAEAFRTAGLRPGGDDGGYLQCWSASGGEPPAETRLCNVLGVLPGTNPQWQGQSVVLGAHYDHLGLGWPDARGDNRGRVHPGADDNASGVAVLLELARVLGPGWQPERPVVFAAFAGEEAGRLGSRHYVEAPGPRPAGETIGMVNLDTVGRLGDGKLLALGTGTAREWVHIFRGAGFVTGVPIETVADDVGGSDQVSFVAAGVPAVQLFTGPHGDYHRPGDTAEKVDLAGLARVAEVTREVVEYLAGRPEALTSSLAGVAPAVPRDSGGGRRASLGAVPDFAFAGPGVRLDGVVPGSPAAEAGLQAGDVLLAAGGQELGRLADLSAVLKHVEPGQTLALRFRRGEEVREIEAVVAAP
ncbi:MAG TPA: M20/M25/M40 family metallo-hydrolase [Deferrisomatales bacterium]|nr:M20/M25/M40 family metallo-hydrolase [Deferrisomatales bacterium]